MVVDAVRLDEAIAAAQPLVRQHPAVDGHRASGRHRAAAWRKARQRACPALAEPLADVGAHHLEQRLERHRFRACVARGQVRDIVRGRLEEVPARVGGRQGPPAHEVHREEAVAQRGRARPEAGGGERLRAAQRAPAVAAEPANFNSCTPGPPLPPTTPRYLRRSWCGCTAGCSAALPVQQKAPAARREVGERSRRRRRARAGRRAATRPRTARRSCGADRQRSRASRETKRCGSGCQLGNSTIAVVRHAHSGKRGGDAGERRPAQAGSLVDQRARGRWRRRLAARRSRAGASSEPRSNG